jgi:hypothetical protein
MAVSGMFIRVARTAQSRKQIPLNGEKNLLPIQKETRKK